MLIFSCDLEEIEEIRCGGMNSNYVLIASRLGIWQLGDFELTRTLNGSVSLAERRGELEAACLL